MHQEKVAKLVGMGVHQAVHTAAVKFGTTVDEVVHAGFGRQVTGAARSGFAALSPEVRKQLQGIAWPWTCPGCQTLAPDLGSCPGCGTKGCEACAVSGKCASCRRAEVEQRGAQERKEDERRRAAAAREKGEREAAQASQRIERERVARQQEQIERDRLARERTERRADG